MTSAQPEPPDTPSNPKVKHIANPRRLLILTPTSQSLATIPPLLHSLTGVPVHEPPQRQTSNDPDTTPPPRSPDSPTPATSTSFAGYTTHSPLRLQTKYYTAEVSVWVDEIPLAETSPSPSRSATTTETDNPAPSAAQWRDEFLSAEAAIVRDAVGAMLVCVQSPDPKAHADAGPETGPDPAERADVRAVKGLMRDVGAVKGRVDEERGGVGDVPGVLVLVGARKGAAMSAPGSGGPGDEDGLGEGLEDIPFSVAWWEDRLFDMGLYGWEVVEWDPLEQGGVTTRNQFGEYEGMPRIKEVLETHDWTASGDASLDEEQDPELDLDDDGDDAFLDSGGSSHTRGFGEEVNELEREMLGLRMAIERGGDRYEESDEEENGEGKVESTEALMMRMQAIREMSSELPEGERKRFAAKAVQDLMREL